MGLSLSQQTIQQAINGIKISPLQRCFQHGRLAVALQHVDCHRTQGRFMGWLSQSGPELTGLLDSVEMHQGTRPVVL